MFVRIYFCFYDVLMGATSVDYAVGYVRLLRNVTTPDEKVDLGREGILYETKMSQLTLIN